MLSHILSMKITGGAARGRIIGHARKNVRPTSSKIREAVFNILGPYIKGAEFLDLFSGTGIMGCEALSRGALYVCFVEKNRLNAREIKERLEVLGFNDQAHCYIQSVFPFIEEAQQRGQEFDIIFMDPPYHSKELDRAITLIDREGILKKGGILMYEHFHKKNVPEKLTHLSLIKQKRYGDTMLTIYCCNA